MLLFVSLSHLYLYDNPFVEKLDLQLYDFSSSLLKMNKNKKSSPIVIVDIDEKSLEKIGQWPWPRIILAQLINKISASNPSAIGIDILLPEKDRTSPVQIEEFYKKYFNIDLKITGLDKKYFDNDLILSDAIKNSESVLSYYLSDTKFTHQTCNNLFSLIDIQDKENLRSYPFIMCNNLVIQNASLKQGFVNINLDSDGVLRKMSLMAEYENKALPSLALATLLSLDEHILKNRPVQMSHNSSVLLNYYSKKWYKKISAIDLLTLKDPSAFLKAKVVLLGSSSVALHDRVIIPQGRALAGIQVNATTIGNILDNSYIQQPKSFKVYNFLISFLMSVILVFILLKKSRIWIVILLIIVLVVSVAYTFVELSTGIYISLGYLLIPFLIHFFIINLISIVIDVLEKKMFAEELNQSQMALFDSMVHVAEAHDIETGLHIVRTKMYVKILAQSIYDKGLYPEYLTPQKINMMYQTSALHDIGKVGISDVILKKPAKLTKEEFAIMKTHAKLGKNIIDNAISSYKENDFFIIARNISYYHHEKFDGSGYPEGLVATEIPLEARIMAVADVYDALMSKRVYKEAFSYEKTREIILGGAYTHFDPMVIGAFLDKEEELKKIAMKYVDSKKEK